MATQAETNNEAATPVPVMVQLQTRFDAITPEQLAAPLSHARDPDDECLILGKLPDDMRRLHIVVSQLRDEQEVDIGKLRALVGDGGELDEETRSSCDDLVASLNSRKALHDIATLMLQHDVGAAFSRPEDCLCPGHVFSDGTIGVHETPSDLGLGVVFSLFEMLGGFGRRRRHGH